ncbi:UDP-D-galactose:(glucosyl)lipopolysaccharide-1, 6-D-galactosyltransferase [Flavobacterium columnare]|uniref:Glycosyltransferase family 4 protein n=3 Tax=Flavobacterium TaxID=237 RepID=A0ABW8PQ33_9FLAO|nr:glycosyltransferase family 4 protein [Flavobacterium columnare]SPE78748.1 UDP-D-galactose:(glucosyl)lipopolysaccharide-1, 6-D-galactosyltransferase [Flavobacterium columnare]
MKYIKLLNFILSVLPKTKNKEIYFFFPSYHLGGAETVHSDILEIFKKNKTICFLTGFSSNDFNKKRIESNTILFNIYNIVKHNKLKKKVLILLSRSINKSKNPIIFGCNSMFFYDLIPFLKDHVKIIDLIHAFSYEEPNASEKYSLPMVTRIDKRIVLGKKTKNDFKQLYQTNNKDSKLLNRIEIIKNKVTIPKFPIEKDLTKITILFVGRDSYEKRPSLFFEIAKRTTNLPIEYLMIGDSFSEFHETNNLKIIGPIREKEVLDSYYKKANILLVTSSREGMPMVILESMAYGVIPITTDVGEINSFINPENKNGILINNFLSEEDIINNFIINIKKIMESSELLNTYSKNAYSSLKNEFSKKIFTKSYQTAFFS